MRIICLISSVFICLSNTASFHQQRSKCCPVLKWIVLSRVSKCLQNCCSCTECYWWWTLTETGIHEFQKKGSLNTFCIKAMQKYPKFSSLVNEFSVMKRCTWYWHKCENDCRNLGRIEIVSLWIYLWMPLSLSLMGCNVMFSVSVSEVQAVFPEPVTREEFSQCKLDIKTCKLSHTYTQRAHTHAHTGIHSRA